MGILDRFTDIIKANINDLLDKAEDPAKMIDQYMRELTDNLADVKKETAAVMAEEARVAREVKANEVEVAKYDDLARRALAAGNEGDARVFLAKKQEVASKGESLKVTEGAMAAFARMEAKADQMLDQANAEAELNAAGTTDRAADLAAQYAATGNSAAVDDELERLKADMGL